MKEGKEAQWWADVTPEMMSDEELDGNVYIRHQSSYRSDSLNTFIKKLDVRLNSAGTSSSHPRTERRLGSPQDKAIPKLAKKWIIKKGLRHHAESREASNSATDDEEDLNATTLNSATPLDGATPLDKEVSPLDSDLPLDSDTVLFMDILFSFFVYYMQSCLAYSVYCPCAFWSIISSLFHLLYLCFLVCFIQSCLACSVYCAKLFFLKSILQKY